MSDGISDDQVSDWGSDFDEDEDPNSSGQVNAIFNLSTNFLPICLFVMTISL